MSKLISTNPGKGYEVVGGIEESTKDEVVQAVARARETQNKWAGLSVADRVAYYEKLLPIYAERSEEIAKMQTLETGKTITQSRGDVEGDQIWLKNIMALAPERLKPDVVIGFQVNESEGVSDTLKKAEEVGKPVASLKYTIE